VKDGEIMRSVPGKTYWVNVQASPSRLEIEPELRKVFEEYYTVKYENYIVPNNFSAHQKPLDAKATI